MSIVATAASARQRRSDPTLKDLAFDYNVLARYIVRSRKRLKKNFPTVDALASSITSVTLEDTIEGSSTLTIRLADPTFELIEYFDIDRNGRLDLIEVNYPEDTSHWWRLHQLGASANAGSALQLELTFIERPVSMLMYQLGPKKTSRAKVTRAEFFRTLVKEIKKHPLRFESKELHKRQQIEGNQPLDDQRESDRPKGRGITKGEAKDLKINGARCTDKQAEYLNLCLDLADELGAGNRAVQAMIVAGIGESDWIPKSGGTNNSYCGIFQGQPRYFPSELSAPGSATEEQCRCFFKGGKGYQGGGAIAQAKQHRDKSPGMIAADVEKSWPNQFLPTAAAAEHYYQKFIGEADDIIQAYGGAFKGGPTYYRAQYNFQIGDEEQPHETYWDGMQRLAEQVNWRLFCDGRTIYFDSDMALIRQQPIEVIARGNPAVVGWSANWDRRKMATEMTLDLICEPFDYRAGQVFKLTGFGPLSRGSTATNGAGKADPLPGRWLIFDTHREAGSYVTTFTLRQPEKAKLEPDPGVEQRDEDDDSTGTKGGSIDNLDRGMTAKEVIDELILPIGQKWHAVAAWSGKELTAKNVLEANRHHNRYTATGGESDHYPDNTKVNYAVDLMMPGGRSVSSNPRERYTGLEDSLAREIIRKFDLKDIADWKNTGGAAPGGGYYGNNLTNTWHKGFKFQLIYRTTDHFNHVHVGIYNSNKPQPRRDDYPETPPRATTGPN